MTRSQCLRKSLMPPAARFLSAKPRNPHSTNLGCTGRTCRWRWFQLLIHTTDQGAPAGNNATHAINGADVSHIELTDFIKARAGEERYERHPEPGIALMLVSDLLLTPSAVKTASIERSVEDGVKLHMRESESLVALVDRIRQTQPSRRVGVGRADDLDVAFEPRPIGCLTRREPRKAFPALAEGSGGYRGSRGTGYARSRPWAPLLRQRRWPASGSFHTLLAYWPSKSVLIIDASPVSVAER